MEAAANPIVDAVNIPLAELPQRTHELPPREEILRVVGPAALVQEAVGLLVRLGRSAVVHDGFRHAASDGVDAVGRMWWPNTFLADVVPRIEPGAVLDLGCGTGRDAVFMASHGWTVTAVDVLPDAIDRARRLETVCAAAVEPIEWHVMNLEHDTPRFASRYNLIVVIRYLHRPLFEHFAEWLEPGGHVVCETFTHQHRERHGRPASDDRVLRSAELFDLLPGFRTRHASVGWHGQTHTARLWAQKP